MIRSSRSSQWGEGYTYRNAETQRIYTPHDEAERAFVYSDAPLFVLVTGGEGAGKTAGGSIKILERIRRGMSGMLVSPFMANFASTTWNEFRRWIPWQFVSKADRHMEAETFSPQKPFQLVFDMPGNPYLLCGGLVDPRGRAIKWEGPNLHFACFNEARQSPDSRGLRVMGGRARLDGPNGEPPQTFLLSTGGCPWLTEWFGPPIENDPRANFKKFALVVQLLTSQNRANLSEAYMAGRASTFDTEAERRIYSGEDPWGEFIENPFLDNIALWDRLAEKLPALTRRDPLVVALDAGISSDSFGLVAMSMHPTIPNHTAARMAVEWIPPPGGKIIFEAPGGPVEFLKDLCKRFNVLCVVYDPYQLHSTASTLAKEGIAWFKEFPQGPQRAKADSDLLNAVIQATIHHDGTLAALKKHLHNADRKKDPETRQVRLVKRNDSLKIDLAVCASMANYTIQKLDG